MGGETPMCQVCRNLGGVSISMIKCGAAAQKVGAGQDVGVHLQQPATSACQHPALFYFTATAEPDLHCKT